MSQRYNLSTSALRESVSARRPPIHPTPITAASTVFTALASRLCLPAHKNHDAAAGATLHMSGSRKRRRQSGMRFVELSSRSSFLFEHDLFRKPVPTFRDH